MLVRTVYAGLALAILIPPLTSVSTLPTAPIFSVDTSLSDRVCTLTRGYLLWPGPLWAVIEPNSAYSERAGLTLVPLSHASRLSRTPLNEAVDASAGCGPITQPIGTTSEAFTFISPAHGTERGVMVVPFFHDEAIHCPFDKPRDPSKRIKGVDVDEEYGKVLSRLGQRLRACAAQDSDHPPVIDIRGFSSEIDFIGCPDTRQNERNFTLAEIRRKKVGMLLTASDSPIESAPKSFRINPSLTEDRWSSRQHMLDFLSVNELRAGDRKTKGDLAQRVEIWFEDMGGACTAESPLALR